MHSVDLKRGLSLATFLVTVALLVQCVGATKLEPVGTSGIQVQLLADAGRDGGEAPSDAGVDGGGWWRTNVEDVLKDSGFISGNLWSLGEGGDTGGQAVRQYGSVDQFVWLKRLDGGLATSWKVVEKGLLGILAIRYDASYCGVGLWPAPQFSGTTGTAIFGADGSAERLLPDPLSSGCVDMNEQGTAIGGWSLNSFLRWPDAGIVLFDFYPYPDGGPPGSFYITLKHLNERNEVVGLMPDGLSRGYANPSGFYWNPDAGPMLLRNREIYGANWAVDINNHGVIVGAAKDFTGTTVGTVWPDRFDAGVYLDHPSSLEFAEARGINDDGLIVGYGIDTSGNSWGLVWWNSKVYFADDIVRDQGTLHIDRLDFVNNRGRMAGIRREVQYGPDGGVIARPTFPITIDVLQYPDP